MTVFTDEIRYQAAIREPPGWELEVGLSVRPEIRPVESGGVYVVVVAGVEERVAEGKESGRPVVGLGGATGGRGRREEEEEMEGEVEGGGSGEASHG